MKKEANMESSRLLSIIFFIYTIILSIGSIKSKDNLVTNQAALFVFGDSLLDVGNNNYLDTSNRFKSNLWPYGLTTFKSPTGRISDGRLISDFLAEYAWLPLIPPYLQPSNGNYQFTYGGQFCLFCSRSFGRYLSRLGAQINNLKKVEKSLRSELGDEEAKRILSRAVYLFHIGANDYVYPTFFAGNILTFQSISKDKFVDFVIGNITTAIEEVYKIGGRKFGFLNLGAYDCAPASLVMDKNNIGSCFKPLTELIKLHNTKLPDVLKRLEGELSGFKYALHDYHTSMSERMNNPLKYGFKEGNKACCGSGPLRGINSCGGRVFESYELCENFTDYLFFDAFHLTEKAHRQIADLIWIAPSANVTGPYDLSTLFALN